MELKEFVKMTLVQISQGVVGAQSDDDCKAIIAPRRTSLGGEAVFIGPFLAPVSKIDFDVAVTVEESSSTEGGAKLSVFSIGVGGKIDNASSVSTVSRIKFEVPIVLPIQEVG